MHSDCMLIRAIIEMLTPMELCVSVCIKLVKKSSACKYSKYLVLGFLSICKISQCIRTFFGTVVFIVKLLLEVFVGSCGPLVFFNVK